MVPYIPSTLNFYFLKILQFFLSFYNNKIRSSQSIADPDLYENMGPKHSLQVPSNEIDLPEMDAIRSVFISQYA